MKTKSDLADYIRPLVILAAVIFPAVTAHANPIELPEKPITLEVSFLVGFALLIAGEGGAWICGNLLSTGYWAPKFLPAWMIVAPYDKPVAIIVGPFILLMLAIVFSVAFVPQFATRTNVGYLLLQAVPLLLTAAGQVLVILTAGIDLSVGQTVTMATVLASVLMQPKNGGVLVAVIVCVGAAIAIGTANALMVVRFRLPPFLATLGMTFFLGGMAL